jgi:hypothetical protein
LQRGGWRFEPARLQFDHSLIGSEEFTAEAQTKHYLLKSVVKIFVLMLLTKWVHHGAAENTEKRIYIALTDRNALLRVLRVSVVNPFC